MPVLLAGAGSTQRSLALSSPRLALTLAFGGRCLVPLRSGRLRGV